MKAKYTGICRGCRSDLSNAVELNCEHPRCPAYAENSLVRATFSDFIRNATPEEKERVYAEVMDKATERQNAAQQGHDATKPEVMTGTRPAGAALSDVEAWFEQHGYDYVTTRQLVRDAWVAASGLYKRRHLKFEQALISISMNTCNCQQCREAALVARKALREEAAGQT